MREDKVIQGLTDKLLQKELICETSRKKKTLQEIVTECKMTKHSKDRRQAMEMCRSISKVSRLNVNALKWKDACARYHKIEMLCKYCGRPHKPKKCSAFGTKCRNFGGKNHWPKVFRNKVNCSQQMH